MEIRRGEGWPALAVIGRAGPVIHRVSFETNRRAIAGEFIPGYQRRHLPDAIRLVGRRRSPRYGPHPQSSALGPRGRRPPASDDPTAAQRLKCRPRQLTPLAAIARSILVIIFHLLADPETRYHDLGPDFYTSRIDTNRKTRQLVHQLQTLGYTVTLQPAA